MTPYNHIIAGEAKAAELQAAFGEYLRRSDWCHFVTLTAATPTSFSRLRHEFTAGFIRRLSRAAQRSVPWFVAGETGSSGLNLHLHALIAGTRELAVSQVERAWKLGRADVRVYEPERWAALYVVKDIIVNPDLYDVSRRLPARGDAGRDKSANRAGAGRGSRPAASRVPPDRA